MTSSRTSMLMAAAALALAGCGSSAGTRSVGGQLAAGGFALDNAVVIARSTTGKAFIAPVSRAGGFHMLLPTGASYKLTLANSTASGAYTAIARISWPLATAATWARVDAGAPIVLANIAPATAAASAGLSPLSDGSGGGGSGGGGDSGGASGGDDGSSGGDDSGDKDDDEIRQCHAAGGESDLPYDVRPALGSTFQLDSAFLAKGPAPAAILSVTGATWRAAELSSDSAFVITQADCDHVGNRSTGRDRVFITWKNADGTTKTDHLDIRYCDGGGSDVGGSSSMDDDHGCEDDEVGECGDDASEPEGRCDGGKMDGVSRDDSADKSESESEHGDDDGSGAACTPAGDGGTVGSGGTGGTTGGGQAAAPCNTNADCAAPLTCANSLCGSPIL